MNLNHYDAVEVKHNTGSWIDPKYRRLYSNAIPYRKYYSFLKRYDNVKKEWNYYLALLDEKLNTAKCYTTELSKHGLLKIYLKPIWEEMRFDELTEPYNVSLNVVETIENAVIYNIDY